MKKILFLALSTFAWLGYATAEDKFVVNNTDVPQGGKAILEVGIDNPTTSCTGYQFMLILPEGISVAQSDDEYIITPGSRVPSAFSTEISKKDNGYQVLAYNTKSQEITGTSGVVCSIMLQSAPGFSIGTVLQASLDELVIDAGGTPITFAEPLTFNLKIIDRWTTLDETSESLPVEKASADVHVLRTIKANEWSTICLPFAMTEAQIVNAFGGDVKFADFVSYDYFEGDADEEENLTVNFDTKDIAGGIEANYPYLIKVSSNINDFYVEDVEIAPSEGEAVVEYDNGRTGARRKVYGTFFGKLHANDVIPSDALFLNGNNFWYSAGNTKIKGFRGYFVFEDALSEIASIKMAFDVNTRINGLNADKANEAIYDLSGRRIEKAQQRGIYIVNGKKVAR